MTSFRARTTAAYLKLFSKFVVICLGGKPRAKSGPPVDRSFRIIARYGRTGGITNGALHNASALRMSGYRADMVDVSSAIRNPLRRVTCQTGGWWIFHCDASQFPLYAWPLRHNFSAGKIVGYFAWELASPPLGWPDHDLLWDEIWTPSRFAAASLAQRYKCPIHVVPHVVLREGKPRFWRKGEEALTFLTMADARSSFIRKNPRAVVQAFKQAFPTEQDVALIVKLQASRRSAELESIIADIGDATRIKLICETLRREQVDSLFENSHVYVSLHRAEGFGLPLLEARAMGLATIATAYSGNLDFMSASDSVLVPFDLITMEDDERVYGRVTWADPNVAAAASGMRRLYESPEFLAKLAKAGWEASRPERQLERFGLALRTAGVPGA